MKQTCACLYIDFAIRLILRNKNQIGVVINVNYLRTFLILKYENQTEKYYLILDHSFHTTLLNIIKIILKIKLFTLDLEFYGLYISLYLS